MKLDRKNQKVFASGSANNGQFGSAAVGTKITSNDVETLQNLSAYLTGWETATIGSQKLPTLEEFQALHYISNYQLAYLFQEGISSWNTDTVYYTGSMVKNGSDLYLSKTDDNEGNALTSSLNWHYAGSVSGLVNEVTNLGLDASVSANALTVKLQQADGTSDPDTDFPAFIPVRKDTQAIGAWEIKKIDSAISLVVPNGATLGTVNGEASRLYVYLISDASDEIAISKTLFDESALTNSTAIGTGSDSSDVLYSTTAKTSRPIILLGYVDSLQALAGTWSAAPTNVFVGKEYFNRSKVAYIKDVKPSNTAAQTIGTSWTTRDLNTVTGDQEIVSLLSNQMTLEPGIYDLLIFTQALQCDGCASKLYNVTDISDTDIFSPENISGNAGIDNDLPDMIFMGRLNISTAKTFEIQQIHALSSPGGRATPFSGLPQVFTQVKIVQRFKYV